MVRLQIRLNAFRRWAIPQKQFIIINIVKRYTSFNFLPTTYSVKKAVRNSLKMCLILIRKLSNTCEGDCCAFIYIWYQFTKSVNLWSCVCNWCNALQIPFNLVTYGSIRNYVSGWWLLASLAIVFISINIRSSRSVMAVRPDTILYCSSAWIVNEW